VRKYVAFLLQHYTAGTVPDHFNSDHRCPDCNVLTGSDFYEIGSVYDRKNERVDTWVCPCCEREGDK